MQVIVRFFCKRGSLRLFFAQKKEPRGTLSIYWLLLINGNRLCKI